MKWRLVIAAAVDRDIASIEAYLAESASQATIDRQIARIDAQIERIAENPLAFSERPLLGRNFRMAVVRPYVLIFRCKSSTVRLLRVVHGARDLPTLLRRKLL